MTPFAKYTGCGNDFILIDNRDLHFPKDDTEEIARLCERRNGIGADGVILLENSVKADFRMCVFNSDGGEAEMCGNGLRCLALFARSLGFEKQAFKVETMQSVLEVQLCDHAVSVQMGVPTNVRWNLTVETDKGSHRVHYLDTGVPHAVLFTDDAEKIDLEQMGPFFRHHPLFAPQGTNVNIAQILSPHQILNRTYERGVEAETFACGTGCTAVAIAAASIAGLHPPIHVYTRSKEPLTINFSPANPLMDVIMTGPATKVFSGVVQIRSRSYEKR